MSGVSLAAVDAVIRVNLQRRPLWKIQTVCDCLDRSYLEVLHFIESGTFPWCFNVAAQMKRNAEVRVLARDAVDFAAGRVGGTKNFQLPEVINWILPKRDLKGAELQRLLSVSPDAIRNLQRTGVLAIARKAKARMGINASNVYRRESVAAFLMDRRFA